MTEGAKLRLFIAASVPELHRSWVAERISELAARWPDARWIPSENQHITVKFLGSTPESDLHKVVSACDQVAAGHRDASIGLTQLGVFPSTKRARVLWVGLDDPERLLASLAVACDRQLMPLGFEPESRPYSSHLTIARFKSPMSVPELPALGDPPAPFCLQAFDLWRSHLSPRGARYERVASFRLGPPTAVRSAPNA